MHSHPLPGPSGDLLRPRAGYPQEFTHLLPGAPLVEVAGDLGLDLLEVTVELGFESLGGLVALDVVTDLVERVDQRDACGFQGVGHEVSVGANQNFFKRPLDVAPRDPYCRTRRIQAALGSVIVVHSHRTQSADGTQKKTGRTARLSPRVPALTTRF